MIVAVIACLAMGATALQQTMPSLPALPSVLSRCHVVLSPAAVAALFLLHPPVPAAAEDLVYTTAASGLQWADAKVS
jgi:hypothetical protein